jgi:hypothetical protein
MGTFDEFEMEMQVKYTEGTELTVLDAKRQSGGERAVATVMYLMALQEMTSSPFRVVDEINQVTGVCSVQCSEVNCGLCAVLSMCVMMTSSPFRVVDEINQVWHIFMLLCHCYSHRITYIWHLILHKHAAISHLIPFHQHTLTFHLSLGHG